MATIVHSCSSVLVRPNGIVRYINAVIDLQKQLGHEVIFVTDAKPTQVINADRIVYINEESTYVPNMKDGHVWLQVDNKLAGQIKSAYKHHKIAADLVIAHDLHSYLGLAPVFANGIFIQHESDVLTPGFRYSYVSDDYLSQQIQIANNTTWRIGLVADSTHVNPPRAVYTPMPMVSTIMPFMPKTEGLLYIGDATERKGAQEFMDLARKLGVTPTVISHTDDPVFEGANVHSFGLSQREEMYELMAKHKVAYVPSKNECLPLAVLECLQFMPVVLNGQYGWTKYMEGTGAIVKQGNDIADTISDLLNQDKYDAWQLHSWCNNAKKLWINLST